MTRSTRRRRHRRHRRRHTGGDAWLAYPDTNVPKVPNPYLAYTGRGGTGTRACSFGLGSDNLAYPGNINAANPVIPSTGPPPGGFNFIGYRPTHGGSRRRRRRGGNCMYCGQRTNLASNMTLYRGGGCGCGSISLWGGSKYPDGLVGNPWRGSPSAWPGVDGISGDRNYLPLNTYNNDISRQTIASAPAPPLPIGGSRRRRRRRRHGGSASNSLAQDVVNLGRMAKYNVASTYNAFHGVPAPVNPMPWKDQYGRSV